MSAARAWLLVAALNGLAAVVAGAYGWHAVDDDGYGSRDIFQVGVDYQMWHALALLAVAWLAERRPGSIAVRVAGWSFALGIVLFSGPLYVLGVSGLLLAQGVAPAGGVLLMTGWAALAWAAVRGETKPDS